RGDNHVLDPRHRARLPDPRDRLIEPAVQDRDHHDAGRFLLAFPARDILSYRVARDQFLERHTPGETQRLRAEASNRTRMRLEKPRALLVMPQLGMNRAVAEAEYADRLGNRLEQFALRGLGRPGRRRVDRLFEVRALERIGLVENRERAELAMGGKAFDGI